MPDTPVRLPLENDPRNPCVGCGPTHAAGLRLSFCREGDSVRTTLTDTARYQGWPMRLHSGILYLAMLETANWTVFGLLHRVGLPKRTGPLETRRWVKAGDTVGITGRLVPATDAAARVRVEATDGTGTLVGILERDYELPGRQAFIEQMGYTELPPGLEDALPE